jgi:hypothetical protein
MKIRFASCLVALATISVVSHAADAANSWLPGFPELKIVPALPANFIVVSADPSDKGKKEIGGILGGVIWAPAGTAHQYEFSGGKNLNKTKAPLFHIAITPLARQQPGRCNFSIEEILNKSDPSIKNAKITKRKWGKYPVMSMSFEQPDGSTIFTAWVGLNLNGWTVLIKYCIPQGKGHPTDEEKKIWERFLSETKAQK